MADLHPPQRPLPEVRSPKMSSHGPVPRAWFADNAVATHLANGVGLLFPAGERFFVRSVRAYLDELKDETLVLHAKRFFGQEGRHAKEHDRVIALLREQGYDVTGFLKFYERVAYKLIERISPASLSLATTAACEHFTALLAEEALVSRSLDEAHPTMRELFLWHAAEEIEHRAVAFDVLSAVAPSYPLRLAGLFVATACLGGFWALATVSLLLQEEKPHRLAKDFLRMFGQEGVSSIFVRGIREYMKRDFHPLDRELDALAERYLEEAGYTEGVAAATTSTGTGTATGTSTGMAIETFVEQGAA